MRFEKLKKEYRPAVVRMLETCGAFTEKEITVALEIADFALEKPGQEEYEFVVACDPDPVGLIVWGADACAEGVQEVYWIVSGRPGVGTELMKHMETQIVGARMCMLETSGKPGYDRQRRFYEKLGFRVAARIHDFYRPGDDLVVYRKDYVGG